MEETVNLFAEAGYEALGAPPVPLVNQDGAPLARLQDAGQGLEANQFTPFQISDDPQNPIVDLHAATAKLAGSEEKPDIQMRIEMLSFQVADHGLSDKAQATLRLDVGQDQRSLSGGDPVFWSIAAGLDLAAQAVTGDGDPRQRTADLGKAFRGRPIEIPGGMAELRIQLVAHEPPPWWRRMFSFADNAAVKKLVAAVGFPAIALDAVKLLDEAIGRFDVANAKSIMQSRPLSVALSARAATEFSGGLATVKPAVLNDGVFVLLRQGDAQVLREAPPLYLGGYGRLVPADRWVDGKLRLLGNDPYEKLSYVILRVRTREAKLVDSF